MQAARTLSIYKKLVGLAVLPMALAVGGLTLYSSARQIHDMQHSLSAQADSYSALLSDQLKPAVAFRDRETAREIMSAISSALDVRSLVLYAGDGQTLNAVGTPGPQTQRARFGVTGRSIIVDDHRITALAPVVSDEGPRGTLAIELSTDRLHASRRHVVKTAFAVGGLALGIGVAAAWLVAGSIARRLRKIVDTAAAVSSGDLAQNPEVDPSKDEIGTLSRAFSAMLNQLRTLIESINESNRTLELRVEERTGQLQTTNDQLKREMEERSKVEVQLRLAQKLESVGRLAAGIAHEINTPIQFVGDNVTFLGTAFADVMELCRTYQTLCDKAASGTYGSEDVEARLAAENTADLDYVRENVPRSIASTQDGIRRVANIVQSMKAFAHPDGGTKTTADLNAAILSTITVASNELKYVAEVQTELGTLPPVPCYLGDINQVFLNLLVNAAHAVGDVVKQSGSRGTIRVATAVDGNHVVVSIADTGTGIPVAVRDRIFDPFFTTKEVGRGTGQGLALARTVVAEKHGGTLTFETEIGKGTTFFVRLPLLQEARSAASEEHASL